MVIVRKWKRDDIKSEKFGDKCIIQEWFENQISLLPEDRNIEIERKEKGAEMWRQRGRKKVKKYIDGEEGKRSSQSGPWTDQ